MTKKNLYIIEGLFFLMLIAGLAGCNLKYTAQKLVKNGITLEGKNIGGLRESEALQIIRNFASEKDINAKNAVFNSNTWQIEVEKAGMRVNVEKTLNAVMDADENEKINLVTEEVKPEITSGKLQASIVKIGSYTTPLYDRKDSRINNIALASEKMDYKKLAPGEEFSFNGILGRRTEAKGYEEAPIIIRTEDGPKKGLGVGGGICQLSTTIYNAVEECKLEITERHMHSKNVGYVPKGEDATVAYGKADLKFKNNRKYPIMIRVYLDENSLTVDIYENKQHGVK